MSKFYINISNGYKFSFKHLLGIIINCLFYSKYNNVSDNDITRCFLKIYIFLNFQEELYHTWLCK